MEKLRLYTWIALAATLFLCYSMWQQDYPAAPPSTASVPATNAPSTSLPALPTASPSPNSTMTTPAPTTSAPQSQTETQPEKRNPKAQVVSVRTDVLAISISTQGGELDRADLLKYPVDKKHPENVIRLLDADSENYYFMRSGLLAADEAAAPTHSALYMADANEYRLDDGQDTLTVPLTWSAGDVTVTKTFSFKRGSYAIGIDYKVANRSSAPWNAASYVQVARHQPIIETSMFNSESYAFMGPAVHNGESIANLKLDKDDSKNFKQKNFIGGWVAGMQHHFVTAAVPKPDQSYEYNLFVEGPHQYLLAYRGPMVTVEPNASGEFHEGIFIGPKIQSQLEAVSPSLVLTADYGKLKLVAGPLFWVLAKVHSFIGNWGWSIILVTLLIKAVFYKLTEASGKSMAKMREMAPRLKALQERYKDDREQLGRATMEFYKREKINPLAGCLPTLVQMPVWMAFYWVILNSAEMRNAPFIGYLSDLSSRDPYYILPVLLGIANFTQFKLNPAPADPVQAKVMMLMPVLMTVMMAWFPAGLALYWITNTVLSIVQQWHINRVVAAGVKKA